MSARRPPSPALALAALLLALPALAQTEEAERAAVRERLAAEREALVLLEQQKGGALAALELLEAMARASEGRVRALEGELAAWRRRAEAAEAVERVTEAAVRAQLRRLAPRLVGLYRLRRREPLGVLLAARDFADLVWRSRALEATLARDLALLGEVGRTRAAQADAARELGRVRAALQERAGRLREQVQAAQGERLALQDAVALLTGQASHARRLVRELEAADAELTRVLDELEAAPALSGFAALKGRLLAPADGVVERGFGRVVNPRFNTVTVQKGLDIRAPLGAPVRAVADGQVVYAGWLRGYGNLVIVDHGGGFHTLVAHLATLGAPVGARVTAGQALGAVGDTGSLRGAYLYFEVRREGQAIDPAPWLAPARPR